MSEEDFHTPVPEEQTPQEKRGGNNMRKLIYGLLVIAVLILVAAIFSQDAVDIPSSNGQDNNRDTLDSNWEGGSVELFGMLIEYIPKSDINSRAVIGVSPENDHCKIYVKSVVRSVKDVSRDVGSCFGQKLANEKYPDEPKSDRGARAHIFSNSWSESYLNSCGEAYEPLGYGNVQDGYSCTLPNPEDLAFDTLESEAVSDF